MIFVCGDILVCLHTKILVVHCFYLLVEAFICLFAFEMKKNKKASFAYCTEFCQIGILLYRWYRTWLRHINFCAPIGKGNNIIEAQKCISNELAHQKNRMIYANHLFNLLGPDVWFDTCKLIKIMLNHA
jgi:hypothetical protein